ncbi:MAG: amidase [Acidimicrobiales bacterium]
MSAAPTESELAARLDADLHRLGVDVDPATRALWVAAVARVDADLGPADGPTRPAPSDPGWGGAGAPADAGSAADGGQGGAVSAGDGPWVWRPARPLAALGSGPLNGLRLAVKDLLALAGQPLGAGSRVRAGAVPEAHDAAVVTLLRRAGAEVVGSVKLHEFAFGVSGINAYAGTPANPAAPGRVPGGSSSGSAAVVAAGLADVALGTDTGGSCRIPAACCGVVGFKPGYGRVSANGVFPLAPSLDHVGWLTRDVATSIAVAAAAGLLHAGGGGQPGGSRRLGVTRNAIVGASPEVRSAWSNVEAVLRGAGWELVDVEWPTGEDSFAASTAIMFAEAAHVHRASLNEHPEWYGEDVRARLLQGRLLDLDTYLRALDRQRLLRDRCRAALAEVTAIVGPTLPTLPPTLAQAADPAAGAALVKHTRLANLTGFPALSIPVPIHLRPAIPDGTEPNSIVPNSIVPFGIQIEGVADEVVLRVGALLEAQLNQQAPDRQR